MVKLGYTQYIESEELLWEDRAWVAAVAAVAEDIPPDVPAGVIGSAAEAAVRECIPDRRTDRIVPVRGMCIMADIGGRAGIMAEEAAVPAAV